MVSIHLEKYQSHWKPSPNRGENLKYLKPPPRNFPEPEKIATFQGSLWGSGPVVFVPVGFVPLLVSPVFASERGELGARPCWKKYQRCSFRRSSERLEMLRPPKKALIIQGTFRVVQWFIPEKTRGGYWNTTVDGEVKSQTTNHRLDGATTRPK